MTLYITDLLDAAELADMIREGRVRYSEHKDLPLKIYNYTSKAQYADKWTNAERVCRGLIVTNWGEVIARGMPKFFNYGSPHGADFQPTDVGYAAVKHDGSLGIGWTYAGEVGVATRGSFHSEQATKATAMLTERDIERIHKAADNDSTRLFEIVYPDNRIVVEYGDREENIPIATVNNETGVTDLDNLSVCGAVSTLAELPIADNSEGFVVSVQGKGLFKLKGEEYLALHKLMYGLTEKTVWEMLQSHNVAERTAFVEKFPPITQVWVKRKMFHFQNKHRLRVEIVKNINWAMHRDLRETNDEFDRKRQALWLKEKFPQYLGEVFAYIDGGDEKLYPLIWKQIKPAHKPYKSQEEE